MNSVQLFLSADPTIGRFNKSTLSDQTLMELFIEKIENKRQIFSSRRHPPNIMSWHNVGMNHKLKVDKITWTALFLEGTLRFECLPATVREVKVGENELSGSIDLTQLPQQIETFNARANNLTGTIDLCHLPSVIRYLNLSKNQLSGSLNLEQLPEALEALLLYANTFDGTVNLSSLPSNILTISLANNRISGVTDFRYLPESLETFYITNTDLSGEMYLPASKFQHFVTTDSKVVKHMI